MLHVDKCYKHGIVQECPLSMCVTKFIAGTLARLPGTVVLGLELKKFI